MQLRITVATHANKLRILRALIRGSVEQVRGLPLRTFTYRSELNSGERFADATTFMRRGWGDCDDAVVYFGARLAVAGIDAWPVIARWRQPMGSIRWHGLLYAPALGRIIDPTAILFPRFAGSPRSWAPPTERARRGLAEQLRGIHGGQT